MRRCLLFLLIAFQYTSVWSQIVKISPANASITDKITITYDAGLGTAGLVGATSVYMHSGVVTSGPSGTDWQNVIGNWGKDDNIGKMTKVTGTVNSWEITLNPTALAYYGVPAGQTVFRLAMVFRNADGSREGKGTPGVFTGGNVAANGDIFINLNVPRFITINAPTTDQYVLEGSSFPISVSASEIASSIQIQVDNGSGFTTAGTGSNVKDFSINYSPTASGELKIKAIATFGTTTIDNTRSINVALCKPTVSAPMPAGIKDGINYHNDDHTKVTLSLLAPKKDFVYVVGDFTDWKAHDNYQMKRSSADPDRFFLEISGLQPGKEYVFQYWVDGAIRVGDPFADKVADPWNDRFIPATVYPDLPPYDKTQYGIATVLQTAQQPYAWSPTEQQWKRPDKNELVVYELLVRDFIGSHDYKVLMDTLGYLKRLGVNAIELLPIMEFEGNSSWGYNPSYFFAPDKYYGTKNDLKAFIEKCHQEGFAVILDMVLNHAFGQNPMVMMYFANGKPTADNPWFNVDATHPFNVGYDFNHESPYTKAFVDQVNAYWIEEYHFDGYRFDLSKGFTQKNNPTNVGAWSAYDQSRIDILTRMANKIWDVDKDAYVILEHFADQSEETVLKNNGMLVWGNSNHDFRQLLAGTVLHGTQSVADLGRVSYMESHDEDRLMYEMKNFGRSEATYNTKDVGIGLNRVKLASAFFYTLPGPKMLWQFQELGYDIDINENGRTGEKPLPWGAGGLGYYENSDRQKLYKATAAIINLTRNHKEVFKQGTLSSSLSGEVRYININHSNMDVRIVGNFSLRPQSAEVEFSHTGQWFDYFTSDTLVVSSTKTALTLSPGQFYIYTDKRLPSPEAGLVQVYKPVVVSNPLKFNSIEEVTFTFDATAADAAGTAGLVNADKVFLYAGVVLTAGSTSLTNFKGSMDGSSSIGEMTKVPGEPGKWKITMVPRQYFGVAAGQRIHRIGMKFRDASGANQGTGPNGGYIFVDVEPDVALQVVTVAPAANWSSIDEVMITFDAEASQPAGALVGANKVYMHAGVITSSATGTGWTNVIGNWGRDDGLGQMIKVPGENNKWQISIVPRAYFKVPGNVKIYRIGMVFRNADGTREGKGPNLQDIFVNVPIQDDGFVTGILDTHTQLELFPNPVDRILNVQLPNDTDLIYDLRIFDMSGSTAMLLSMYPLINGGFSIEVGNLPSGVYMLTFSDGKSRYAGRLIKQ